MIVRFRQIPEEHKYDYFKSLLLIALVPLFPEYISFFLVIGSLLYAVKDIKASGQKVKFGPLGVLLSAYCLYLSITCLYSTHPLQSALATAMWWFMLLAYLIIVNLVTDKHRLDTFLFCISTVAAIVGFIAVIQNQLNIHFGIPTCSVWEWLDNIVFEYVPFDLTLQGFPKRSYSTFANPNMLAQYLIMAAPFVISYNFIENRTTMRLYNRVCLIMTAVGVMVSFSRGGYLALIVLALAIVIVNLRKRFATVLLYLAASLLFIPTDVYNRLTTLSDSGRQKIWNEAVRKIAERPLLGYGAGTQPSAVIFNNIGINAPHAHNIPLQILIEGGFIALLIILAVVIYTSRNGLSLMFSKKATSFWAGFAVCGFICVVFLHGLVDYPLTTPRLICVFMSFLAITERYYKLYTGRWSYRQLLSNRINQ